MSEQKVLTGNEGKKKIGELIKDVRICMMTTAAGDGTFDSRPMATQQTEFDGTVWFLTRHESQKVAELQQDANVTLLYSDPAQQQLRRSQGQSHHQPRQSQDPRAMERHVQSLVPRRGR